MKKKIGLVILVLVSMGVFVGCGEGNKTDENEKKVKVAFDQVSKPTSYIDEKGNPAGYEIELFKLVDEKLTDYEFEYVGTSSDDLLIGVQQGKYDVGIKNAFWTQERVDKYIFPKEFLGLSSVGFVLKNEKEDIKSLEQFATDKLSLAPIAANNAQYTIIDEYNKANPENKINLVAGDSFTVDVIQWVNEGRVDGGVIIESSYNKSVKEEDGKYNNLNNSLVYNEFAVIKTWPLFNKDKQEFANAYDEAIKTLKEEKKTNELIEKFYGRNLFQVLDKVKR